MTTDARSKPTYEELHNRFSYHQPPDQDRRDRHDMVSSTCLALAERMCELCPAGRNLALALTHLEDVRMRANAAIACDSPVVTEPLPDADKSPNP